MRKIMALAMAFCAGIALACAFPPPAPFPRNWELTIMVVLILSSIINVIEMEE